MDNLATILENLNREQLEAVEQIEGPVMVIAGPGTGKTQILSARIANILEKTDTDPGQILCLTYTEAGVSAMRKRLISMIGPLTFIRILIVTNLKLSPYKNGLFFTPPQSQPISSSTSCLIP